MCDQADSYFDSGADFLAAAAAQIEERDTIDRALIEFLRDATWSDFAGSLYNYYVKHGTLTPKQLKAAESMKAKCDARKAEREAPATPAADGLDLSQIPSGMYAVPGGETRLKVQIDVVQSGKWEGWVFVKDGAEYGRGERYGSQKPGDTYRGKIEAELRQIAADPFEASKAYGRLVGRCGVCNRPLENEESVAAGIGPICAGRF